MLPFAKRRSGFGLEMAVLAGADPALPKHAQVWSSLFSDTEADQALADKATLKASVTANSPWPESAECECVSMFFGCFFYVIARLN